MSRWATLLLLLGTAGGSLPVVAQDRQALAREVARLERRVDSLRHRHGEAAELVTAASVGVPLAKVHEELRAFQVGGLRVLANDSPLPVEAGARETWSLLQAYFGTELIRLPVREVVLEGIDPDSAHGELGDAADRELPWNSPPHDVMVSLLQVVLPPPDDSALVAWLRGAPAPMIGLDHALARVRTELILSPFSSGRECIAGAIPACLGALQLVPAGEWAGTAFPRPSDRTEVLRVQAQRFQAAGERDILGRCLSQGDEPACADLFATLQPGDLPLVADASTRRTLLAVALRRGGPDGYHRLLTSVGRPMRDRLAAAAGVPVDSLLAGWLAEVDTAAHAMDPWSARIGFSGIAWAGLLLLASLRSSRWRAE